MRAAAATERRDRRCERLLRRSQVLSLTHLSEGVDQSTRTVHHLLASGVSAWRPTLPAGRVAALAGRVPPRAAMIYFTGTQGAGRPMPVELGDADGEEYGTAR